MASGWRRGTAVPKCIIAHARQCLQESLLVRLNSSVGWMEATAWTAAVYSTRPLHPHNTASIRTLLSLASSLPPSPPWSGTDSATAPRSTAPRACRGWSSAVWSTSSSRPTEGRPWRTPTPSSSPACLRPRCSVSPRSLWPCRSARAKPKPRVSWWESSTERLPTSQTSWTTSPTSSPMRRSR